jgi:hypothetical protein
MNKMPTDMPEEPEDPTIQQDRLWRDERWTACVIKNEDDEGWAVSMTLAGEAEPALVGPWTMGRDKKNPKPLSAPAFHTLVKTASEVLRRHEQQLHAQLHKRLKVDAADGSRIQVQLDITPDEDNPYAMLSALDQSGLQLAEVRVSAGFKLNESSALAWVAAGFERPG